MAEFDPHPKLSPAFKGLVFSIGVTCLGIAAWGIVLIVVGAIRFFLALP